MNIVLFIQNVQFWVFVQISSQQVNPAVLVYPYKMYGIY